MHTCIIARMISEWYRYFCLENPLVEQREASLNNEY